MEQLYTCFVRLRGGVFYFILMFNKHHALLNQHESHSLVLMYDHSRVVVASGVVMTVTMASGVVVVPFGGHSSFGSTGHPT